MVSSLGKKLSLFLLQSIKAQSRHYKCVAFTFKERLAKMWCLVWVEGYHRKGKNLRNEENLGR